MRLILTEGKLLSITQTTIHIRIGMRVMSARNKMMALPKRHWAIDWPFWRHLFSSKYDGDFQNFLSENINLDTLYRDI